MNDLIEFKCRVLLATQTAFLGMISDRIRAVTCCWSATRILVKVCYHGPIDAAELGLMSEVESEILSHFAEIDVDMECLRIDLPKKIDLLETDVFVFKRRESEI